MALRHGVACEHLDYIQIHPTTLYSHRKGRRFLISESVRGEGALLLDKNGNRFSNELQPRDVVSAAIRAQMEKDGTDHVWEDMRPIGEAAIREHFPNILEPFSLIPHSFWVMNHLTVDEAGFPSHQGPLDPQWLLILVLDVRTDTACFMWGYELDPYVEPDLINKSIMKARIPLRESMLLQAVGSIMKDAVQLVARKARSKVRHPMRYGLTPPPPANRKGGGL